MVELKVPRKMIPASNRQVSTKNGNHGQPNGTNKHQYL